MKNIITFFALIVCLILQAPVFAQDNENIIDVGFKKTTEVAPIVQIKQIFENYQKYSNSKDIDKFLALHEDDYVSSDGYTKEGLKDLAINSWKEFPNVKYTIRPISITVDIDNATVITEERLYGSTPAAADYVKGNGHIDSNSTSIYYLKRCSNDWKISSDFIINEKTSLRYGIAKYIPMTLDAPPQVTPQEEYTAILKVSLPASFMALTSINNEIITFPAEKSTESFRSVKSGGVLERILKSNDGTKNENAIASIGIARPTINNENVNINIVGIAFLSSRVNVIPQKYDTKVKKAEEKK